MNMSFIRAFASAAHLDMSDAYEQWAAFSRQLSDTEIAAAEAGDEDTGTRMGADFLRLYPDQEQA